MGLPLLLFGWLSLATLSEPCNAGALGNGQCPSNSNYGEFAAVSSEHTRVSSSDCLPGSVSPSREAAAASHKTATSREILYFVNEFRRSKGLPALQANSFISSVALGHSRDMLTGKTPFGHDGFRQRIDRISGKLGKLHVAAENVASGPMDAREVVDGWLHSPGHRRNIMGDFQLTGIGVAEKANGMIYFTQIFVR